jgi:proteasome lid subunit RPN8/RPN11
MEPGTEIAMARWTAPECPFRIEYSTRVLDDIRLAVVDAFFSLPRGGAEIGGILLGTHDAEGVTINGYEALDCEHAMGPSFTLSPRDQTLLAEMTARARRNPRGMQPVGWYHSHTRSAIFLSETDQDIHKRYFPEPWQIALVLKPHTFEPMRGGFFFREADGSIRGTASYQEFVVDTLPPRAASPSRGTAPAPAAQPFHHDSPFRSPVVEAAPEPSEAADAPPSAAAKPKGRVPITREIAIDGPLADSGEGQEPEALAEEVDVIQFTQLRQERSWRSVQVVAAAAVAMALLGLGYETRQYWLPQVMSKLRPVLPKEPDTLALTAVDDNGQLNIQWDRNAPAIRNALDAVLEITDGNPIPRSIRLDAAHLAIGAFTYGRESERVDVALSVLQPNGQQVHEVTSFLGKLPSQKARTEDPAVRKERDAMAQKADKLQKDLNSQASRTRKLERDLQAVRDQLQNEQRSKASGASTDPGKTDPSKKDQQ